MPQAVQEACPAYAEKLGAPLYILDPTAFVSLCNRGKMQGMVAQKVLRYLLDHIQIRFNMASTVDVGDGRTMTPGKEVERFDITTVELGLSGMEKTLYQAMWTGLRPLLNRRAARDSNAQGLRDTRIHRHLALATFDIRLSR